MTRTVMLILTALALIIGSFVWFVATWDPTQRPTLSQPFHFNAKTVMT